MQTYEKKLLERIKHVGSGLCVGLDPRLARIKGGTIPDVADFLKRVVDETFDLTASYKPNIAYFECLGYEGIRLLEEIIAYIPSEVPVILDAKRSDIGETQKHYADAYFKRYDVDAITLNPLMGFDSLEPYLEYDGKAVYLLALTSNAGSAEYMRKKVDGVPFYLRVTEMADRAKDYPSNVGFVMGLTNLKSAELQSFPDYPLLIPGLGAQGGEIKILQETRKRTASVLVNVSRGILFPTEGVSHRDAAQYYVKQLLLQYEE